MISMFAACLPASIAHWKALEKAEMNGEFMCGTMGFVATTQDTCVLCVPSMMHSDDAWVSPPVTASALQAGCPRVKLTTNNVIKQC